MDKHQAPGGASHLDPSVAPVHPPLRASEGRRRFIRLAVQGAAAPALGAILGGLPVVAPAAPSRAAPSLPPAELGTGGSVVRDFKDPYLELLRLLHVAAEIEHALMNQYLYAAYSIKPAYQAIAGLGTPNSNDLLGVAIQEMQHLGKVNQLLVALGATPTLIREDFPYEPDIYPFPFHLEPLSRASLAKYVWTEAPVGATDIAQAGNAADREFCAQLRYTLGKGARPNYVGSLYDAVIDAAGEVAALKDSQLPQLEPWIATLQEIKAEGETGHFAFFKSLFMGTHEGFGGDAAVWDRPIGDPLYPAYRLPVDPTAYVGHEHQIPDRPTQSLAWLGDLHYWIVLTLLSIGYSRGSAEHVGLARAHMVGPFWSLARKLSRLGSGMPFDPLGVGYGRGLGDAGNDRLAQHLLEEADRFERQIVAILPSDYPVNCCSGTRQALAELAGRTRTALAPRLPWDDALA